MGHLSNSTSRHLPRAMKAHVHKRLAQEYSQPPKPKKKTQIKNWNKLKAQEKTQINWGMDKQLVYSHCGILLCNEKKLLIHGKDVAES